MNTISIYEKISEVQSQGEAVAFCTIVETAGSTPRRAGSKMLVFPDGHIEGTVGGGELEALVVKAAQEALENGKPRTLNYSMVNPKRGDPGVCGGTLKVYIEPVLPPPTILLVGAGHVGKAVVSLAKWLGYRVVVADDRPEFCTPETIPGGDEYLPGPLEDLAEKVKITTQTAIIFTTRSVDVDVKGLPLLLGSAASYIGVIGSRRRWATTCGKLESMGIDPKLIEGVVSPIGLEINAETPEEIAVSIFAEIIMLQRGGDGQRMK